MLQVFLVMNHIPTPHAPFKRVLQQLKQQTRFHLTVLNNGQPLITPHLFHQLGLTCDILHYPLQFHPAQLLAAQIRHKYGAEHILWFEDELIWNPEGLAGWTEASADWTWITPHLLPSSALPFSERIYQQQAFRNEGPPRLESTSPQHFPPCLFFRSEEIPTLKEWLQPQGQLPLFMLSACDLNTPAWHPDPSPDPATLDFLISIDEALERWDDAEELNGFRQQALWESLQRALPDSPEIYPLLLPRLSLGTALEVCAEVVQKQWQYPRFLELLSHALDQCDPEQARQYRHILRTRFPAYTPQASPWKRQSLPQAPPVFMAPRPQALHVGIRFTGEMGALFMTLESLLAFHHQCEVVIFTDQSAPVPLPASLKNTPVRTARTPLDMATLFNQYLQDVGEGLFLLLEAGEVLPNETLHFLQHERWAPAPGLPVFLFKHITSDHMVSYQARFFAIHPLIRFANHPVLRVDDPEGKLHFQKVAQAVIEQPQTYPAYEQGKVFFKTRAEVLSQQEDLVCQWEAAQLYGRTEDHQHALSVYSFLVKRLAQQSAFSLQEKRILQSAILGCLRHAHAAGEPLAPWLKPELDIHCINHPDYWYYQGIALLHDPTQEKAAQEALEKSFMHQSHDLDTAYCKDQTRLHRALVTLEKRRFHVKKGDMRAQREHLELCLKHLYQWIQCLGKPEDHQLGQLMFPNPYFILCELALLAQPIQLQNTALDIFTQNLPTHHDTTWGYILETALLYEAGQFDLLPERLPPTLDHEVFRRLSQEPHFMSDFCKTLWPQSEVDGPQIASAFTWVSALSRQDAGLLMLWYEHLTPDTHPLEMLESALLSFGQQAHFLCYVARMYYENQQKETARQMLQRCLDQHPDFEPAHQLRQKMENRL